MLQTIVGFACGTTLGMAESGMERVGIEDCLKVDFEYGKSQNKNKNIKSILVGHPLNLRNNKNNLAL